jgi:outer membrane protein
MRRLFLAFALWPAALPAVEGYTLLQLYEQTLTTNPLLKGGEASIDQARAREDQAMARLLPNVSAYGNLSWTDFTQDTANRTGNRYHNQYLGNRAVVQASQALFDLPAYLRYEGSGATVKQTEQELESSRMAVTAELIDRYFTVLEAGDEMGYLEGEIALTRGDMQRIRRMFERQLAMITDVYEVEAYYQTLLTRRLELENARAVALEKLRETVGVAVEAVAPLARELLPEVPGQPEQWVAQADQRHPALKALTHAAEAAAKDIDSTRAEHLPKVSVQANDTYANNAYDNRQVPDYNSGQVGLQLNLPIYAGGAIEAAAREAGARHRGLLEKLAEKRREIDRETRTAYLDARTGHARIAATARELEARDKARAAQERSYELGVATIVALLDAKRNYLKARFELARARYGYIRSLIALRLWAGHLAPEDVADLNGWLAKDPIAPPPPPDTFVPTPYRPSAAPETGPSMPGAEPAG